MPELENKVALVTGGAGGLGSATARALAARELACVVSDIDPAGAELAEEIGGSFIEADVSTLEANREMVAFALASEGGLDLVFLNAGIASGVGLGDDFDEELYRRAMGINLDGVVFGTVAALPVLREGGGGSIVATASLAGLTADPVRSDLRGEQARGRRPRPLARASASATTECASTRSARASPSRGSSPRSAMPWSTPVRR